MFIKELSDEAYLDVKTRFSDLDFYQDNDVPAASLEHFIGYISIGDYPKDKGFDRLIFDPVHNRYFAPIRHRKNSLYLIVVVQRDEDDEEVLISSGLLNHIDIMRIKHNDVDACIVLDTNIKTYEQYKIRLVDNKCS